ncbi:MAG: DUF2505 family protein [Polyangiaceae bacterium]
MTETRIVNELECSEATFWEVLFFDAEFNRRLFLEELKFASWKVVSERKTEDAIERELEVCPNVGEIPGALKAVVGEGLSYSEHGRYDRKRRRYVVKAQSPKMGNRVLVEGEMTTEPIGENRCRRIFAVKATAKIFGVGGLLEKRILADLEKSYAQSATFIGRYVREIGA